MPTTKKPLGVLNKQTMSEDTKSAANQTSKPNISSNSRSYSTSSAASNNPAMENNSNNNNNNSSSHNEFNMTGNVVKNRNEVIRLIQEITKLDGFTINQAIEACQDSQGKYSMDSVMNILMDEQAAVSDGGGNSSSKAVQSHRSSGRNTAQNNAATGAAAHTAGSSSTSTALPAQPVPVVDDKYWTTRTSGNGASNELSNSGSNHNNAANFGDGGGGGGDDDAYTAADFDERACAAHPENGNVSAEQSLLRLQDEPSGLKNVGNTCWFNSIIQAFFHLPYFRRLILSFQVDKCDVESLDENSRDVVLFVSELRKLFALMLKSRRRVINPSLTLRYLRNCSKYDVDTFNQEDVSEFATILVNLIEESFDILFKLQSAKSTAHDSAAAAAAAAAVDAVAVAAGESMPVSMSTDTSVTSAAIAASTSDTLSANQLVDKLSTLNFHQSAAVALHQPPLAAQDSLKLNAARKNRKNPIVNLLNGDMLIHRTNSDEDTTSNLKEIFREINIQMLNSRNLHAGLELEWGETSIDKQCSSSVSVGGGGVLSGESAIGLTALKCDPCQQQQTLNKSFYEQESWVVQLPPVLFICLNRYKFVKATQSSSKILEPFEFYPYIYLDRYMHLNRDIVKAKRKELKKLNNDLLLLEEKLNSISNYKCDEKDHALALNEALKCTLHFATTDFASNELFKDVNSTNANNISAEAVASCLRGWIERIETRTALLRQSIDAVRARIGTIYEDDELRKVRYNLHSVCIHEGNATSGHFWTYIWNTQRLKWYKFNDAEVCETTWDDLYMNAVGGGSASSSSNSTSHVDKSASSEATKRHTADTPATATAATCQVASAKATDSDKLNAPKARTNDRSAYFLVYSKADDITLYQDNCQLDADLHKLIAGDQQMLATQLNTLKFNRIHKDVTDSLKRSTSNLANAAQNAQLNVEQNNQTCIEHAKAFSSSSFESLTASFDYILADDKAVSLSHHILKFGADEALKHAIELELNKYAETADDLVAQLPGNDVRMHHIVSFFGCNGLSRDLQTLALLDILRMPIFSERSSQALEILQSTAQLRYNEHVLAYATQQSNMFKAYEKWQGDYRDYRSIVAAFINAVNFMDTEKFEEAAPFFCVACEYNERITANLSVPLKGMDHAFLLASRRKCFKLWATQSIRRLLHRARRVATGESSAEALDDASPRHYQQQLSQQELTSLFEGLISKFLPCLFRLAGSTKEDKDMLEELRQDWLKVLDANLPELPIFQDFMTKLFEDPSANHFHSLNVNKNNLIARYAEAIQICQKHQIK